MKARYTQHFRIQVPTDEQIVIQRGPDGVVCSNVAWVVKSHSPSGFQFGYSGSGPADLALNILENVLTDMGYDEPMVSDELGDYDPLVKCWDGNTVFMLSWKLHQPFKQQFIATLDQAVAYHTISVNDIIAWIREEALILGVSV